MSKETQCFKFGSVSGCRENCPVLEEGNCEIYSSAEHYRAEMELDALRAELAEKNNEIESIIGAVKRREKLIENVVAEKDNKIESLKQHTTELAAINERLKESVDQWIKTAAENQKSANKSAESVVKAEAELAELREKMRGVEEVLCFRCPIKKTVQKAVGK